MKRKSFRATVARLVALGVVVASVTVAGASVASAAPPVPSFRVPPEGYASYQGQSTCDPTPKPGTVSFRALVLAAYPETGDSGIGRACSVGGTSEHKEGRAWDWRVSASGQGHIAGDLLNWLLATRDGHGHALLRRFGIMYIIWNRQIFRAYRPGDGWQPYTGSNPHTDHVHFSFGWPGAHQQTSWWTGSGSLIEGWGLHDANAGGGVEHLFTWDVPDACTPLTGDWDGNGTDTVGAVCRNGDAWAWALLGGHSGSAGGPLFSWGSSGCLPTVGDWDGNGSDTPGTVCASNGEWQWGLHDYNQPGGVEHNFGWGSASGCWPVVGDWNGDRRDTPGVVCPRTGEWQWVLHDHNQAGGVEHDFGWGSTGCGPVIGDWDGNGSDTPGTVCAKPNGEWQWGLHDHNLPGGVEHDFGWGSIGHRPIVGDWDGNGTVTPGTTSLSA